MKADNQNRYELPRWSAVVTYRSENGPVDVLHYFDEYDELGELIERGPDWNCIEKIVVKLHLRTDPSLTLEGAA